MTLCFCVLEEPLSPTFSCASQGNLVTHKSAPDQRKILASLKWTGILVHTESYPQIFKHKEMKIWLLTLPWDS